MRSGEKRYARERAEATLLTKVDLSPREVCCSRTYFIIKTDDRRPTTDDRRPIRTND